MTIAADPKYPRVSWNGITVTGSSNDDVQVSVAGTSETISLTPGTYRTSGLRPSGGGGIVAITCILYELEARIAADHSEFGVGGAYEGEHFEITLDDTGHVRFALSDDLGDVVIEWTHGNTTADPAWWGFDGSSDFTLSGALGIERASDLVAPFGWSPNCGTVNGDGIRIPEDIGGEVILPPNGKHYATDFGEVVHLRAIFDRVAAARIYEDYANHSGYAAIAQIETEDTNACLRALWKHMIVTDNTVYYRRTARDQEFQMYFGGNSIDMRKFCRPKYGADRHWRVDLRLRNSG